MRPTDTIIGLIQERGRKGLPLERVYRLLYNPELYLAAYGKIYRNNGSMTPGSTEETADGMSMEKIERIITALRNGTYQWTPTRRKLIPKKNGKKRPLGITSWTDKLVQEVLRMILEAYYEPCFKESSHGFRSERGCHTALREIHTSWTGTIWYIEGDISKCFDCIDHTILLDILKESIHDPKFLALISQLLKAGYMEEWRYHSTLSGTPQGSIVTPLTMLPKRSVYQREIPRAQLCAAYGDGFHGAPLDCTVHQPDHVGTRDPGAHHDQTRSQAADNTGGTDHV